MRALLQAKMASQVSRSAQAQARLRGRLEEVSAERDQCLQAATRADSLVQQLLRGEAGRAARVDPGGQGPVEEAEVQDGDERTG